MQVIIVGQSNGQKVICWMNLLLLWLVLSLVMCLGILVTYWLLSGTWSLPSAMLGLFSSTLLLGGGVKKSLETPIDQLHQVD
ncbi:MAG: hypothetical protein ACF8OB_02705 [Phycisphaeraceae bacterium JB051]